MAKRPKIGSAAWAKEKNKRTGSKPGKKSSGGKYGPASASGNAKVGAKTNVKGSASVAPSSSGGSKRGSSLTGSAIVPAIPTSRGDYGRSGSIAPPSVDPALIPNAATGLVTDPVEREALRARLDSRERKDLSLAENLAILGELAASSPVGPGLVLKGAGLTAKALKAAKVVDEAVETGSKVSKAAKLASKAKKAKSANKAEKFTNKAEKAAARARVKKGRQGMTTAQKTADRAKNAKTRAQAATYGQAYKVAAGGAGAGGLTAREIAKKSDTKRGAAALLAREAAKAPARGTGKAIRGSASPAVLPVTGTIPANEGARNLATAPYELGRATVEAPGTVAKATITSTRDMLLGLPAAVKQSVTDPVGAAEMMIEDYKYRYGPLAEGDADEFRKRVQEGGLTPYALDALVAVGSTGRVAGSVGRSGALGKKVKGFTTDARPKLQKAAGEAPESQPLSKNVAGVAAQRVADKARRRATNSRAGSEERPGQSGLAVEAKKTDAVVPINEKRVIAKSVAATKSRGRQMMLTEQKRVLDLTGKLMRDLDGSQQEAVKWALALGLRTADDARRELPKRIADIREKRGGTVYGKSQDNIPELERIIANADEIFTPEFNSSITTFRRIEKRLVHGDPTNARKTGKDPALEAEQATSRRYAQQAQHLGIERLEGESAEAFVGRVRAAARQRGLGEGGYFPSELSRRRRFSQSSVGGTRHSERTKRYSGKLFEQGIENNGPDVLVRGLQRNVKRKQNWNMVSDTFERHAFKWSKDVDGQGKSMVDIQKELARQGISEDAVVFVNPGLLRKQASDQLGTDGRASSGLADSANDDLGLAIQDSTVKGNVPAEFEDMKGWYAVPKALMDELEGGFGDGKLARLADVGMSKMQKYMLSWNVGWLGFQTISNAAQMTASGVGPVTFIKAQLMWRKLAQEQRAGRGKVLNRKVENSRQVVGNSGLDRLNAYAGTGQSQMLTQAPQFGAASRDITSDTIRGAVEGYRIFKEGKWGQRMSRANPINSFFEAARFPEDAMRRAVAYKLLKTEAGKRMNANMSRTHAAIDRVTKGMELDPEGQMRHMLKNPKDLEQMAKGLHDFMGDYSTFTARERSVMKRMIPFYSWMRFATKFAFFTLPVKHPAATGLLYQMGRLETAEVRELIGDDMPWGLGKLFLNDGKLEVDVYRGNPVLSGLTDFESAQDLMGFVPPYLQLLTDQIYGKDYFTGADFTVEGETTGRQFVDEGLMNRARILANSVFGTFTPYRVYSDVQYKGVPQTSDALPFDPRPKQYAPGSGSETREREIAQYEAAGGTKGILLNQLPFVPSSSAETLDTANYLSAETAREKAGIKERKNGGSSATGMDAVDAAIDQAMERAMGGSDSAVDKAIDEAMEKAGL